MIGLGYVGFLFVVEFGWKWNVVGFDISECCIKEFLLGSDSMLEVFV